MATVKPGWEMPEQVLCSRCKVLMFFSARKITDNDWEFGEVCCLCNRTEPLSINQPFVEPEATAADFEALGFEVFSIPERKTIEEPDEKGE